jgi:hypothetical protein
MATRRLANRRIDRIPGAGNTRVDAGTVLAGTPVALAHHSNLRAFRSKIGPPESPSQISLPPPRTPAQSMTEFTMSPSFKSLHVSQAEAALEGSTEINHRQDLIIDGIATDSVQQLGVRFGLVTRFSNSTSIKS